MTDVLELIASLVVILAGCEVFVNAVEWLGRRLDLDDGATGSLLAAVGTALPETLIPVIAIVVVGDEHAEEVGIGAIMGAPFLLATLALAVTAVAVLVFASRGRRGRAIVTDRVVMGRDLSFFLVAFTAALVLGVIGPPLWLRILAAVLLPLAYILYVWQTLSGDQHHGEALKPLYLQRRVDEPARLRIALQVVVGLGAIVGGAELFVSGVEGIAGRLGISTLALSLLVAPLATELPEKVNSVFWVRDRKDTLALGNITGAMVFQSTIPVAVGLALTEWSLDTHAVVSALLALASGAIVWGGLRITKRVSWQVLALGLPFYVAFVAYVIVTV